MFLSSDPFTTSWNSMKRLSHRCEGCGLRNSITSCLSILERRVFSSISGKESVFLNFWKGEGFPNVRMIRMPLQRDCSSTRGRSWTVVEMGGGLWAQIHNRFAQNPSKTTGNALKLSKTLEIHDRTPQCSRPLIMDHFAEGGDFLTFRQVCCALGN